MQWKDRWKQENRIDTISMLQWLIFSLLDFILFENLE